MNAENYIDIFKHTSSNQISIVFSITKNKPYLIGEKINQIYEEAYMNGYNWEVLLDYFLRKKAPNILKNMKTDPEADTYVAYYDGITNENEEKAEQLAQIIEDLIENENKLYEWLKKEGNSIEWD